MYQQLSTEEVNGKLKHFYDDMPISEREYDTRKYYDSTEKADWKDIYAAVDDYEQSMIWN